MSDTVRQQAPSDSPWAAEIPHARARRAGNHVWVGATTGTHPDGTVPEGWVAQTRVAARIVERALADVGSSAADVVMLRVFVVNLEEWRTVATILAERFGAAEPASTLMQVARLMLPEHLIAIEAEAIVGG